MSEQLKNVQEKEMKEDKIPNITEIYPPGVLVNDILIPKAGPGESGGTRAKRISVVYWDGRNPI